MPRPTDKVIAKPIRCLIRQGLPLEGKLARVSETDEVETFRSVLRADEDIGPYEVGLNVRLGSHSGGGKRKKHVRTKQKTAKAAICIVQ